MLWEDLYNLDLILVKRKCILFNFDLFFVSINIFDILYIMMILIFFESENNKCFI